MRRLLLATLMLGTLATLSGCATLDEQQSRWIFRPTREAWRGAPLPADMQEVWIEFQSRVTPEPARLHGLWHPQPAADKAPVLLYLHGARWDVRGSTHRIRRMHELGFSVLAVDYRGFGKSSGELPNEDMAYEDAREAWNWLAQRHGSLQRYIFGHSLGGAIAVHLAAEVADEAGLIVEGTFTSVADVLATYRWGFSGLGLLLTQRFQSDRRIAKVGSPVLVVHGKADNVIAPELGERLYALAQAPKRLLLVDGGSHHNTNAVGQPQYRQALREFFQLQGTEQ